jgi:hypothetical protein
LHRCTFSPFRKLSKVKIFERREVVVWLSKETIDLNYMVKLNKFSAFYVVTPDPEKLSVGAIIFSRVVTKVGGHSRTQYRIQKIGRTTSEAMLSGTEVNDLFKTIKAAGGGWYNYITHTPDDIYNFVMMQEKKHPVTMKYIKNLEKIMMEEDPYSPE